ncbi:MAG: SprT-like domain-containing protein [Clostridium sp.]|nr:SprT-like domain-containing protein [Clostridium sp.]
MRATAAFVRDRFDRFNRELFGGILPPIAIRISRSKRTLGTFVFPAGTDNPAAPRDPSRCTLTVSSVMDFPENEIEDTIIHEMIHYYIWFRRIADNGAHGLRFRALMDRINRETGRTIGVRRRLTDEERDTDTSRRHNYIISLRYNGRRAIAVCARTKIFEFHKAFSQAGAATDIEWFWSCDPWFNRFPQFRTPKFIYLNEDDYARFLSVDKTPCTCDGRRFAPVRK